MNYLKESAKGWVRLIKGAGIPVAIGCMLGALIIFYPIIGLAVFALGMLFLIGLIASM